MESTISMSCSSASDLVADVTGTWWKSMPYDRTSGPASGWLETTAGMSICTAPVLARKSRSLRQCRCFDTMMSVR